MSENYSGRIDPMNKEWESSEWTLLLKERYALASLFSENKIVLDSCCGTGYGTVNFIIPKAKFTTAHDLCESAADNYGKTDKYEFLVMDGRELKMESNSFDIVLSLDAIEHFNKEDGLIYLSEMKRVCKNEGAIIGTTPLVIDASLIPVYLEWNKFHHFMYTRQILRKTLKNFFRHVEIYEIFSQICPYFLFICSNAPKSDFIFNNRQKIRKYLTENRKTFNSVKISSYFAWEKMLLKKGRRIKALYMLLKAYLLRMKAHFSDK